MYEIKIGSVKRRAKFIDKTNSEIKMKKIQAALYYVSDKTNFVF